MAYFTVQYVRHEEDGFCIANTPVMSITFNNEKKARDLFELIKEGNCLGQGYILKLYYDTCEEANILDEVEF